MNLQALARILTGPRHQSYVKLVILGLLVAASLLPLRSIRNLVLERQETSLAVEREIVGSWGGEQRLVGPVLVVPVTVNSQQPDAAAGPDTDGSSIEYGNDAYRERLHVLPELLAIDSEARPQVRHRGIYQSILYTSTTTVSGSFARPDFEALGIDGAHRVHWNKARIEVFVADFRGIVGAQYLDWNGESLPFRAGDAGKRNITASLPALGAAPGQWPARFSFTLDLKGSRTLGFFPLGDRTGVTVRSTWPHPSFFGGRLPIEAAVAADGFEARWEFSHFDRELPQAWLGGDGNAEELIQRAETEGALVRLIDPVDHYLKSERSVKYGVLFVILVSCVLFVFEIMSGARVHPVQYGMVAAALCLFFLLLLSLSEAVGFGAGYLLAAGLTVALLSYYIAAIFRSLRRGAMLAGLLAIVYGYLYLTLSSEDHALLLGSVLLFAALAGAMIVTRRFDWYGLGGRLPAARNTAPATQARGGEGT